MIIVNCCRYTVIPASADCQPYLTANQLDIIVNRVEPVIPSTYLN